MKWNRLRCDVRLLIIPKLSQFDFTSNWVLTLNLKKNRTTAILNQIWTVFFISLVPVLIKTREKERERKNNSKGYTIFLHTYIILSEYKKCHSNFYDFTFFINHNFFFFSFFKADSDIYCNLYVVLCISFFFLASFQMFVCVCFFAWNNSNKLNHFFDLGHIIRVLSYKNPCCIAYYCLFIVFITWNAFTCANSQCYGPIVNYSVLFQCDKSRLMQHLSTGNWTIALAYGKSVNLFHDLLLIHYVYRSWTPLHIRFHFRIFFSHCFKT